MSARILLLMLAVAFATFSAAAQETLETLTVGAQVYSNVTVTTKTRTDIFISHSQGIASIKVHDLEPEAQVKLGYESPKPAEPPKKKLSLPNLSSSLQFGPAKVREVQEKITENAKAKFQAMTALFIWVVFAVLFLFYLLFCYLCKLICLKAGYNPGWRAWVPIAQRIALLRAANMSALWVLAVFIPFLDIIRYILWAVNISKARGKSGWTALALCLPIFNIFAFLYLALADSLPEDESNRNVVRFHSDSRSAA